MRRLDAISVRESNGKSYFKNIGVAFENKAGDGWNVLLDAMPAPTDGQFKFMLKPPQQRDDQRGGAGGRSEPGDDSIPF